MKRLFIFVVLSIFLVSLPSVFAETWEIQIPPNSSKVDAKTHYNPPEISVRPGDTVKWGNTDNAIHTVTSGSLQEGIDAFFDSGHIKSGETFAHTFSQPGEFKYFCTIHPWMTGIVNVIDLPKGFKVIHNVGSEVSETSFDVLYNVKRNLTNIEVNPARNSLTFNFVGKITNDVFFVYLPNGLIKDPQSVWVDDTQITDYILNELEGFSKLTIPLEDHSSQVTITGTKVIGKVTQEPYVLINQILAVTDKKTYHPDDAITISGKIQNINQLTYITYNVISPKKVTLLSDDIMLVTTKFSVDISTEVLREFGEYAIEFEGSNINAPTLFIEYEPEMKKQLSPKKQMVFLHPGDVVCNDGLVLLMKNSDGSAVCVTESTGDILMIRGWADYF